LAASKVAYKNLMNDNQRLKNEATTKIEALKSRLAERPVTVPTPVASSVRPSDPWESVIGARKRPYHFSDISVLSFNSGRR
jgi:hypothetical protein